MVRDDARAKHLVESGAEVWSGTAGALLPSGRNEGGHGPPTQGDGDFLPGLKPGEDAPEILSQVPDGRGFHVKHNVSQKRWCQMRYFCDGAVFGRRKFVEDI